MVDDILVNALPTLDVVSDTMCVVATTGKAEVVSLAIVLEVVLLLIVGVEFERRARLLCKLPFVLGLIPNITV